MTVAHQVGIPAAREGLRLFISLGLPVLLVEKGKASIHHGQSQSMSTGESVWRQSRVSS